MSTTMTSPVIEATSLHQVTQLAANPPSNPNAPLSPDAQPLVLYIARVPGSRDVFLTPIKPREKVVTAGDVQSSLYYLHINGLEDYEAYAPPTSSSNPRPQNSANTAAQHLPPLPQRPPAKKIPPPLPRRREDCDTVPTPPYPTNDGVMPSIQERPPSPPPHQYLPGLSDQISRKPVFTGASNGHQPTVDLPAMPARKPLPTSPSEDQQPDTLHSDNVRLLRQSSLEDSHDNPYTRSYATHPETLKQQDLDSRPDAGTLTLIRRDPGSGEQWNVASIHDPSVEEVSSNSLLVPTAGRRTKRGGAPLYLDVTNPGYSQFASGIRRIESRNSSDSRASSAKSDGPEDTFRRRLYMPGSKFSEHGYSGHRKHSSVSSASGSSYLDVDSMRRTLRSDRHHSVDIASLSSASASPVMDRRSKGYTFTSPWNGQCEFTTGATGRSLKCRHQLSANYEAMEVSELRFNLPTKSRPPLLASKPSSSHLFRRHQRQDSFDSDSFGGVSIADDGRINLDLGRERAGGGFGGKQAKLGKLIVWPEGVKMLDLLVAANVGLWWRAWERSGGGGG